MEAQEIYKKIDTILQQVEGQPLSDDQVANTSFKHYPFNKL